MAQVDQQIRYRYGSLLPGLIPGDTLREISQGELEDRLAQAHSIVAKAAGSTPGQQRAAAEHARKVLSARPRAAVEDMVRAKVAKAALSDPLQAEVLRRQARELLLAEPPAVRRADVAKAAKGARRVAVYDDRLRLLGTAPAKSVVQNVRKADAGGKKPLQPVFDESGSLIGIVDPDDIMPVAGAAGGKPQPAPAASEPDASAAAPQPAPSPVAKAGRGQARAVQDPVQRAFREGWVRGARRAGRPGR